MRGKSVQEIVAAAWPAVRVVIAIALAVFTWAHGVVPLWAYHAEKDLRVPLAMDALIININGYQSPPAVAVTFRGLSPESNTEFTLEVLSNERVEHATVDVTFAGDIARSLFQPPHNYQSPACMDYGNFLPISDSQLSDDEFTLLDGYTGGPPRRQLSQMQVPILPDFHTSMIARGQVFGSGLDLRCIFSNENIVEASGANIAIKYPRVYVNRDHGPAVPADARLSYYPETMVAVMMDSSDHGATVSSSSIPAAEQIPPSPGGFPFTDLGFAQDRSKKTFIPTALYGKGSYQVGYTPPNRPPYDQPPYGAVEFGGVGLLFNDPIAASSETRTVAIASAILGTGIALILVVTPGFLTFVRKIFSALSGKKKGKASKS